MLVAGDWHLGTYSAPGQERLALAFLRQAADRGDSVILNGDIFEGLFEPVARAERAHPAVSALIAELAAAGVLRRTEGNHDPGTGAARIVLEHPPVGRVLVAHGHQVDPVHDSGIGNFGDGISRRFGRLSLVRGAASVAEAFVAGTLASRVDRMYRRRCLAMVERAGCALGVFGHNHRRHLASGDAYANAGRLRRARLEYLVLDASGAALRDFTASGDAAGARAAS
ncbi:MAG: metallophosphoesterase [Gemmatimonadota bacterium]|nr:metallophosphoesterase [Gemmatimonadota bacterium]